MNLWKQLGRVPRKRERKSFLKHVGFDGKRFSNPYGLKLRISKSAILRGGAKLLFKHPPKAPLRISTVKTDLQALHPSAGVIVVWLGHSSLFLKTSRTTLMVDPVLSPSASPFPGGVPAFPGTVLYSPEEIPDLDLLVITHDHYDHLDAETVCALAPRVRRFVVPLGVGAHLRYWGIPPGKIIELGWGDCLEENGVRLVATPAVHMAGRHILTGRTLWVSYVLSLEGRQLFIGGDGGYSRHFKEIGLQYGPFDLAFIENGQYNSGWPLNHLFPEQTYQAAKDLRAQMLFPVHWGKFCLSTHAWNAPLQRLLALANEIPVTVPRIGEPYKIGSEPMTEPWWMEAETHPKAN